MSLGILEKMMLVAYTDNSFTIPTGNIYPVLINPESYSITYGTDLDSTSAQGSSEDIPSFNRRMPQSITFKFLFDGTGVINRGDGIKPNVLADFELFKTVVYDYNSDAHEPRFIQLRWGPLNYNCQLSQMTLNFKLFNPDGTPLRAEADCTFRAVITQKKLSLIQNMLSPDLTHIRTVTQGDTLSLLCYREYGDSKYYYQVAEYNGLTDFKTLEPGTKIFFPPIAK